MRTIVIVCILAATSGLVLLSCRKKHGGGGLALPPVVPAASGPFVYFENDSTGHVEIWRKRLFDGTAEQMTATMDESYYVAGTENAALFAFSRARDSMTDNADIWTVTWGQAPVQITSTPEDDAMPAFNPAGDRIAWSRDGDIWIMEIDGSNPQPLTSGPDQDWDPSFNFDGTKIAFTRFAADSDIYVMNDDGTGLAPLLTGPEEQEHPCWCKAAGYETWIAYEIGPNGTSDQDVIEALDTSGGMPIEHGFGFDDADDPVFLYDGVDVYLAYRAKTLLSERIIVEIFANGGVAPDFDTELPGKSGAPSGRGAP